MRVGSRRVAPRVSCGRRAAGASQRRRTVSRSVRSRRDPRTRVPGGVTDGGPAAIQPTCSKSSRGFPREHPGPDARSSSSAVRPGSAKSFEEAVGGAPVRPVPFRGGVRGASARGQSLVTESTAARHQATRSLGGDSLKGRRPKDPHEAGIRPVKPSYRRSVRGANRGRRAVQRGGGFARHRDTAARRRSEEDGSRACRGVPDPRTGVAHVVGRHMRSTRR